MSQHLHLWPQYFRERIKAEAEGRPYTPPPPSKATSGAARPVAAAAGGMTRNSRSFGNSAWDDWGDGPGGAGRHGKVRTAGPPAHSRACVAAAACIQSRIN